MVRLLWKHAVISVCSAVIVYPALNPSSAVLLQTILFFAFPLGFFTDMVRLRLKIGRLHSLITKCCLYAAVFFISPEAAASAIVTYFRLNAPFSLFSVCLRLLILPESRMKMQQSGDAKD
nr:transporter [Bacillus amyloliquefaciens]MDH3087716.1 transporter [Bacillus amyloliquefaciens]